MPTGSPGPRTRPARLEEQLRPGGVVHPVVDVAGAADSSLRAVSLRCRSRRRPTPPGRRPARAPCCRPGLGRRRAASSRGRRATRVRTGARRRRSRPGAAPPARRPSPHVPAGHHPRGGPPGRARSCPRPADRLAAHRHRHTPFTFLNTVPYGDLHGTVPGPERQQGAVTSTCPAGPGSPGTRRCRPASPAGCGCRRRSRPASRAGRGPAVRVAGRTASRSSPYVATVSGSLLNSTTGTNRCADKVPPATCARICWTPPAPKPVAVSIQSVPGIRITCQPGCGEPLPVRDRRTDLIRRPEGSRAEARVREQGTARRQYDGTAGAHDLAADQRQRLGGRRRSTGRALRGRR